MDIPMQNGILKVLVYEKAMFPISGLLLRVLAFLKFRTEFFLILFPAAFPIAVWSDEQGFCSCHISLSFQEERVLRSWNVPQMQDEDHPIAWKVQFSLGNNSQSSNQCRNSVQGKLLITDELGKYPHPKPV